MPTNSNNEVFVNSWFKSEKDTHEVNNTISIFYTSFFQINSSFILAYIKCVGVNLAQVKKTCALKRVQEKNLILHFL